MRTTFHQVEAVLALLVGLNPAQLLAALTTNLAVVQKVIIFIHRVALSGAHHKPEASKTCKNKHKNFFNFCVLLLSRRGCSILELINYFP